MPYISPDDRCLLQDAYSKALTAGELNYHITRLVHKFLLRKTLCYTEINAVIGVLECAKLELYRQVAAPYEDDKKSMNGPVSELDGGVHG